MNSDTQKKLHEMYNICERINKKTEIVREHTDKLKLFNIKLEALLYSIDTYSTNIKHKTKNNSDNNSTVKEKINLSICDSLFSKDNNKISQIAKKILMYLLTHNEFISLNDIVTYGEISKYKTVEILTTLLNENILIQKFDNDFMYKINVNIEENKSYN